MTSTPSSSPSVEPPSEDFGQKAFADILGFVNVSMCVLGSRLGLFKDLAANGPATSDELAARTGIVERYAREWLSQMACAGYLGYDPPTRRFNLPEAHRRTLADEGVPGFLGAMYEGFQAIERGWYSKLLHVFRSGGGISYAELGDQYWDTQDRHSAANVYPFLIEHVLPAIPDVHDALARGMQVADVGCGRGGILIALARAFPASSFIGYDAYAPNIEQARANAAAVGVDDRVRFEHHDAAAGLPEQADLVLSVDSLHHAPDVPGVLAVIRAGLAPGGVYLCSEAAAAETLEGNLGPSGTMLYASGVFVCVPTVMTQADDPFGPAGLPPSRMRELGTAAGFSRFELVSVEGGSMYVLRP